MVFHACPCRSPAWSWSACRRQPAENLVGIVKGEGCKESTTPPSNWKTALQRNLSVDPDIVSRSFTGKMSLACSVSLQIEVLLCAWECLETDGREAGYSRSAAAWMRSQKKKRNDKEERQWGIQYVARILRENLGNVYPVILLMWGLKILDLVSTNSSKHVALQHKKHTTSLSLEH